MSDGVLAHLVGAVSLALMLLVAGTSLGEQAGSRRVPVPGQGFLWAPEQLAQLREVMGRWSRGMAPSPEEVKAIFAAGFDPRPPRETVCIRAIERGLVEHLQEQNPSLLLPLTFWQVEMVFAAQGWTGETIPRTADFERVLAYLADYRTEASKQAGSAAGRAQVVRATQLAWLGVGELYFLHGTPAFLERADQAFEMATKIDEMEAAKYWLAFLREKIRSPVDVLRPLRELVAEHPDDPEYRLRFGLVARRAERLGRAAKALESVARGEAPEWMRVLAYEEWVQVLLEGSKRDRQLAGEILAEARIRLPGQSGLDLLAVYLQMPESRRDALLLAERIESRLRPVIGRPPRIRYEFPSPDKVDGARADLLERLRQARRDLATELGEVHPSHFFTWHVPATCKPLTPG